MTPPLARIARAMRNLLGMRHASVRRVRAEKLTYLEAGALADLIREVRRAEWSGRPGSIIEAGCALGGSAIVLAKAARRPVHVHDLFGMPPPTTAKDGPEAERRYAEIAAGRSPGIGGDLYYGYVPDLLATVVANLRRHGLDPESGRVSLVKGPFEDTLRPAEPVAVAHIDCDRYESVKTCIERIAPVLAAGGVMIFDDYDTKSGCRRAVDEYFGSRPDRFELRRRRRMQAVRR